MDRPRPSGIGNSWLSARAAGAGISLSMAAGTGVMHCCAACLVYCFQRCHLHDGNVFLLLKCCCCVVVVAAATTSKSCRRCPMGSNAHVHVDSSVSVVLLQVAPRGPKLYCFYLQLLPTLPLIVVVVVTLAV